MTNRSKKRQRTAQLLAAAALLSSTVAPYAVQAEEIGKTIDTNTNVNSSGGNIDTAMHADGLSNGNTSNVSQTIATPKFTAAFEEKVNFAFTTAEDFTTNGANDGYLKAFVSEATLVLDETGKAYADITFGGHSYAMTAIKLQDAAGDEANIIEQTGSAATKDWVRTIRVPLDEQYQAHIFLESARGNYTYRFDFAEESTPFQFTTGSGQDSYFSAWLPNADVVQAADGTKYAYITFAGHSYAIADFKEQAADGKPANIIKTTGSAEDKNLQRTIRIALDANNKAVIFADGGQRGSYTFAFDFTPKVAEQVAFETQLTDIFQPITFNYTAVDLAAGAWHGAAIASTISSIKAKKAAAGYDIHLTLPTKDVANFTVMQGDQQLAKQAAGETELTFHIDSFESLLFNVDASSSRGTSTLAVHATKPSLIVSEPSPEEPKQEEPPKQQETTSPPASNPTDAASSEKSISWDASATVINGGTYGAADGNFIVNYLKPYMTGAKLVTVNGTQYVDLTLTGHATAIQSFSGAQLIDSSNGDKIARFPAAATVSTVVNAGDYGTYNYTFAFDLGNGLASLPSSSTGSTEAAPTTDAPNTAEETTALTSTGDASFDLTFKPGQNVFKKHITAAQTTFKDGTYTVNVTLNATNGLTQFNVLQNGKQIATWKKAGVTAFLASLFSFRTANTDTVSFEVASLDGLTFEAVTADGTYEAGVKASTKETAPVVKDGPITYTMQADPNGAMPEFITNYLAPYFSNAQYKTIDGKPFVELTLKGKAYGFATLQYTDADNQQQNVEVISSTGEGIDQVRVVRLPLVQDKNGVTKVFVDSGSIGYGAYTLFFKFNVPTAGNPFTDIEGVYSKDEIIALYKAGITTGTTATTYSPSRDMTRAQFAVMIARAFNITSTKETAFADIKGKSYAAQIQGLVETGIVKGVNATTFNPNAPVTRQQAALMMERMLTYKGYTFTADVSKLSFTDKANISTEAKAAFAELQAKGILTGSNGYANPASTLKRAQMAKILKNALDLVHALD